MSRNLRSGNARRAERRESCQARLDASRPRPAWRGPRPVDGESLKEGETQESQGRPQPERSGHGGPNRQGE